MKRLELPSGADHQFDVYKWQSFLLITTVTEVNGKMKDELPPDPGATIFGLRSIGYELNSAVADIIDNSIEYDASVIEVFIREINRKPLVAIVDNGVGMSKQRLKEAMTIGSPRMAENAPGAKLGKFGFGLKTASFSQASVLSVLSRSRNGAALNARMWDIEEVQRTGKWVCPIASTSEAEEMAQSRLGAARGTAVVWQDFRDGIFPTGSQLKSRDIDKVARGLTQYLGLVFHRFLSEKPDGVKIYVNGFAVKGWNPFHEFQATIRQPRVQLSTESYVVSVSPMVLPHKSKLSDTERDLAAGALGMNALQGFYVYRQNRIIVFGEWFDEKMSKATEYDLARISIDLPVEADSTWSLDVAKSRVIPPASLEKDLRNIAEAARAKSKQIYASRGVALKRIPLKRDPAPLLQVSRLHGKNYLTINRKHPTVAGVLESPEKKMVGALLTMLESAINHSQQVLSGPREMSESAEVSDQANLVASAKTVFDKYLQQKGVTFSEAAVMLAATSPFNEFPGIVEIVRNEALNG